MLTRISVDLQLLEKLLASRVNLIRCDSSDVDKKPSIAIVNPTQRKPEGQVTAAGSTSASITVESNLAEGSAPSYIEKTLKSEQSLWKCSTCGMNCYSYESLNDHIISAHWFRCTRCSTVFSSKSQLENHCNSQNAPSKPPDKKQYACGTCGKMFPSRQKMKFHKRRDHEKNRRYTCRTCKRVFFWWGAWDHHVKHCVTLTQGNVVVKRETKVKREVSY